MIFTDRCQESGRASCAVCARSGQDVTVVTGFGAQGAVVRFVDGVTTWAAQNEIEGDAA